MARRQADITTAGAFCDPFESTASLPVSSPADEGDPEPTALRSLGGPAKPGHDELELECVDMEAELFNARSVISRWARVIVLLATVACATRAQADAIEAAGDILAFAMPAAAGAISLGKGDRDGLLELGVAYTGAVGTTLALKSVVHEWRPDHSDERSFPSGAATSAFASAAYLDKRYGWHYGLPAYALATFVGYSRVEADKHHWYDVAAGALIGWTFNQLITTHSEKGVYVAPIVSTEAIGLDLRLRW